MPDEHRSRPATAPASSAVPYRYCRRIQWGDADPAQIAYTARFLDFLMDAIDSWLRDVVGLDWYSMGTVHGIGAPAVHVEMDFRAPLRPGDELVLQVLVERVGTSSLRLGFHGTTAAAPVYAGQVVLAFIERQTMRSTPIPSYIREPVERYASACARRGTGA